MRLTVISIQSNAVVSQCLTKNNRFKNMRRMGAFRVYAVETVGEFLVKCGNQLVIFDLDGSIQKVGFI